MVDRGDGPEPGGRRADGHVEATRDRLLSSALAVFGRVGFEDTRVEDICRAAGSSRATFYRHFSGKDDVFDGLLSGLIDELEVVSSEVGPVTADAAGFVALRHLVVDLMSVSEAWSPVIEALSVARRVSDEQRRRATATTVRVSRSLGRSIGAGGAVAGDPTTAALALIGVVDGIGHQIRTWDVRLDRSSLIDSVTLLILRMLHPGLDLAAVAPAA